MHFACETFSFFVVVCLQNETTWSRCNFPILIFQIHSNFTLNSLQFYYKIKSLQLNFKFTLNLHLLQIHSKITLNLLQFYSKFTPMLFQIYSIVNPKKNQKCFLFSIWQEFLSFEVGTVSKLSLRNCKNHFWNEVGEISSDFFISENLWTSEILKSVRNCSSAFRPWYLDFRQKLCGFILKAHKRKIVSVRSPYRL